MVSGTKSVNELKSNTTLSISGNNETVDSSEVLSPDPQVKTTGTPKRQFTKAYKLKFLNSYDACANASERGALLRREGLYYSRVCAWKKQLGMNGDGGKKNTTNPRRTDHMAREIEQLKKKLAQAQAVIDLQKKVSELLGTHILPHDNNEVS